MITILTFIYEFKPLVIVAIEIYIWKQISNMHGPYVREYMIDICET
jgi:hypothetical protein